MKFQMTNSQNLALNFTISRQVIPFNQKKLRVEILLVIAHFVKVNNHKNLKIKY